MPTCNKITCTILLPPTNTPLPEYKRRYLDSSVSVHVPVPDIPILKTAPAFNIDLRADDYIAPGLAMFVFIDGVYQANRSKLVPPPGSSGGSGLRMTLRQKEEKIAGGNGAFVGREWRWVELDVERANEAAASSKDAQSRVGKIEVVILRCAERVPIEEPQVPKRTPAKTSAKAPSAKAPSAKANSTAKAASEASAGLGGMFGLFDGACDFELDGTGEVERLSATQNDYQGMHWDATEGRYKFPKQNMSDLTGAERASSSFGLDGQGYDGQGYDHPGVVVNQFGQPYDPRVPYYNTSTSWTPNQQRPGYAPHSAPPAAPAQVIQGRRQPPSQGPRPRPPILYDAQGNAYDVEGNAYLDRAALDQRYTLAPVPGQEQPFALPQGAPQAAPYPHSRIQYATRLHGTHPPQAQNVSAGYEAPPQGHPIQTSHGGMRYYPGPQQQMLQPSHVQRQPQQAMAPAAQEPHIVNPELQRFWIFERAKIIEKLLGLDHRIVQAAVPYLPILQTVPIPDIEGEQVDKLKRDLTYCIKRGGWPNGDPMGRVLDLVKSRYEPSKSMTPTKHKEKITPENHHTPDPKPEKKMTASEWQIHETETLKSDASAESKSSKHKSTRDEWNNQGKQSDDESKSTQHFGNDNKSQSGNDSGQQEPKDEDTDNPWANNKGYETNNVAATGGWDACDGTDAKPNTSWDNEQKDQNTGQQAGWGWPDNSNNNQAQPNKKYAARSGDGTSSQKTSSSRNSRSSTTSNPHAYVQPYFQTWRGNTQNPTATNPPRHQPREPYAYPATPAPHLPASKIGDRSHGVQAGKGADYTHRTYRPTYLDTEGSPYAVFVFHYRSAEKLEEILGHSVKSDLARIADEVGRGVLMSLPREKLVEELMKAQGKGNGSDGASRKASSESGRFAPAAQDSSWEKTSDRSKAKSKGSAQGWEEDKPAPAGAATAAGNGWDTTPKGNTEQAGFGWKADAQGTTGQTNDWAANDAGATANPKGGW